MKDEIPPATTVTVTSAWDRFFQCAGIFLAVVGILVAAFGICQARKMGDVSLEWQRQTWALQRAKLRVETTLKYGDDKAIIGELRIQNQGPAPAVLVVVRIDSKVTLRQDPVLRIGARRESIRRDETGKVIRHELGDLMKGEAALIELKSEPSIIHAQLPWFGYDPFGGKAFCRNCDDDETEYVTMTEGFPELPVGQEYIIKPGDIITDVLKPFGYMPEDLEWWNPDFDITQILPGQKIIIPPPIW